MSLIDSTYFQLEINIPDSDYNDLSAYITRYEKEILIKLLGYELWKLVDAYDSSTSPQRIKDIVEGKEYELSDGELIKWNGLKNSDKISLIAYYVYYWYLRNNATSLQGIGVVKQKGENSNIANMNMKISAAWNRLQELYYSAYEFLSENESDYEEWEFSNLGSVNNWDL
jgi:hypothetical protein